MIKVSIGLAVMLMLLGSTDFANSAVKPKCPAGYKLVRNRCDRQVLSQPKITPAPKCPKGWILKSGACRKK
jgi:hypothetical protein